MSDTLTALAKGLGFHTGVHPIALASQSYQVDSVAGCGERLLNMYAEKLPPDGRAAFILKPTPGTSLFTAMGSGPLLCSASVAATLWAVSGSRAYMLPDNLTPVPVSLGAVGTCTGSYSVTIAIGVTGVVIVVPPNAYVTDLAGAPLQQITGGNFPAQGVGSVCYQDGYYIFTTYDGTSFFVSALLDATTFSGLSMTEISSQVDYFTRCVAHAGEVWMFCQNSVQVWYDSGDPTTPYYPRAGGVIHVGTGSARTIVDVDDSLFWLGVTGIVYRNNGYSGVRVSNHAVEAALADYNGGNLLDISACGFTIDGHPFYSLSLPTTGRSFVYDCASQTWHERSSAANGIGPWTINTASMLGARVLLGDAVNGNLYHQKASFATENGVAVPREAILPVIVTHGPRGFMARLEVEMEVGTANAPGSVGLSWSDDGGMTWTAGRTLSTGALGATRTRVVATRLGSFRQRSLKLTAQAPMTIYGVNVDVPPPQTGV